jgi:N-acetyltransferase 10
MGYGSRALEQLQAYYEGKLADLNDDQQMEDAKGVTGDGAELHSESVKPRKNLPPLLAKLDERYLFPVFLP